MKKNDNTETFYYPTNTGNFTRETTQDGISWIFNTEDPYSIIGFVTNYEPKKNRKYAVSFEYKYNGGKFNDDNFGLTTSKSKTSLLNETGILRKNTIPAATDWTKITLILDTSVEGLVTDEYKYLAVYGQTLEAIEISFRNLSVCEAVAASKAETEAKKVRLYNDSYKLFCERITSRGYADTSSTGTYSGMFIRDTAMQIMVHNAAGDTELSRKLLNNILAVHKQGGADWFRHIQYNYKDSSTNYKNIGGIIPTKYYTEFTEHGEGGLGICGSNNKVGTDFVPKDGTVYGVSFYMSVYSRLGSTSDFGKATVSLRTKIDDETTIIASKTLNWESGDVYKGWKTFMFDKSVNVTVGDRYYFVIESTAAACIDSVNTASKYRAYNYDHKNNLIWERCGSAIPFSVISGSPAGDALATVDNNNSAVWEIPSLSEHITAVAVKLAAEGSGGKLVAALYKGGYGENARLISRDDTAVGDIPSTGGLVEFKFGFPLFDIDKEASYYLKLSGRGMTDSEVLVYGVADSRGCKTVSVGADGETDVSGEISYRAYRSRPTFDTGHQQTDGGYMIAVAWAQYVNACKMTAEDISFIGLSYPVLKDLVNYYVDTDGYQNEWGLIFNPQIEHTRDGRYWEGYNLITNCFAAEAFCMLAEYAKNNDFADDAQKWSAEYEKISDGINEHLVLEYKGKKFYGELYGDTELDRTVDLDNSLVVGFSYENFAPIAVGWHGMDIDIMKNTYDLYRQFGTFETNDYTDILNTCTYVNVTFDENNPKVITDMKTVGGTGGHLSGKTYGWELILCNYLGDAERIEYLTDFMASLYRDKGDRYIYIESVFSDKSFEGNFRISDRGNMENCGMVLYAMNRVFPRLQDFRSTRLTD